MVFLQWLIRKSVRVVCGWSLVQILELFVVILDYSLSRCVPVAYPIVRKKKIIYFFIFAVGDERDT